MAQTPTRAADASVAWRRWTAHALTHRCLLLRRACAAVALCAAAAALLWAAVAAVPDNFSAVDLLPLTRAFRARAAAAASVATDGGDTLRIALGRLIESDLPARSWFVGDCARYETRFARPGSLPDARLASFFRSGNTWTRYLLEAATGLFTCGPTLDSELLDAPPTGALPSVAQLRRRLDNASLTAGMTSAELRRSGFVGEHVSPTVRTCVVGKTHAFPPEWRRRDGGEAAGYALPAILLVRDPFRALVSLRHFRQRESTHVAASRADGAAFAGANWTEFVVRHADYWLDLSSDWATSPRDTLLVAYERLTADPAGQLRRMLRFLGVTPAPGRLDCALRHLEGGFHNRQHPVAPADVFDAEMRRQVWSRILLLNKQLTSRGYQRLPVEQYSFFYDI